MKVRDATASQLGLCIVTELDEVYTFLDEETDTNVCGYDDEWQKCSDSRLIRSDYQTEFKNLV